MRSLILAVACWLLASPALAVITINTAGAVVGVGNNTNVTPTLPTHSTNDLLLCLVMQRGDTADDSMGTSTGGWANVFTASDNPTAGAGQFIVWYKVAASGAETNPTFTIPDGEAGETNIAMCFGLTGADTADPLDVIGTASHHASQVNIGPINGITPTTSGAAVCVFGYHIDDGTAATTLTTDGLTWTETIDIGSNQGNDGTIVADCTVLAGAPPTISASTITMSSGSAHGGGITVSFNASGGAPPAGSNAKNLLLLGVGE